jgi:hypothetical protein
MLGVPEQLGHALFRGPAALGRLRARGWTWFLVYLGLATLILGAVAKLLIAHRGDAVELLVGYVFPDSWHFAGRMLIERMVAAQDRAVVVNGAIGASLLVVQVLLFPIKEKLSAAFEREARLVGEPGHELPLLVEAWEEIKLFLAFLAAQMSIFWIGYSSDPSRRTLALVLSHAYLFVSFGIDFLTPVLQRHGQTYAKTLKVLASHPAMLLAFGALFSLPPILVGRWIAHHPELSFTTAVLALFAANIVAVAWAAVAGTHAGAQLLDDARATRPPSVGVRGLTWILLIGLLAWNGYRFGAVALSLHHKSQILKCEYALDWTSIEVATPGALDLLRAASSDKLEVAVSFDVTIENPTRFDVELEQNRLELTHEGQRVASAQLSPVRVPAGGTVKSHVSLPVALTPSQLARGTDLLKAEGYALTLWLEVASGFELPIYILEARR